MTTQAEKHLILIDAADYFEDRLGVTGDEFNKLATYIY